jgi:hypothetical protein
MTLFADPPSSGGEQHHPLTGMSFGVAGTITPLVDLWLDEGRLPTYMRAVPKAER